MIAAAGSKDPSLIWTPGKDLEPPIDNVSPEQVREAFRLHVAPPGAEVVPLADDSLSALVPPKNMPAGIAFVDIDDFVHNLSDSLQGIQHSKIKSPLERRDYHDYGEDMFYRDEETTIKHALIALVKSSKAGMRPAENIDEIRHYLIDMRQNGIYTCYLTVSTPGSEVPTIENFLGPHLRSTANGIVCIKGDYREVDKGMAAASVMEFIESQTRQQIPSGMPVVAMDDWSDHLKKIRNSITALGRNVALETVQLACPSSHLYDESSTKMDSVLGCVQYAHDIFR